MRKKFTLNLILFISCCSLSAQITDVITGVNFPWGIAFNGDELYITEAATGTISKINITDATPTPSVVVSGLSTAIELAFNGNDLYINEFDAQKISKINITDAAPIPTDVLTGITSQTYSMQILGDDLYFGEYSENKVSKIDISLTTPTSTDVVTGLTTPSGLFLDGNTLYISESEENKISKIDIIDAEPTPVDVFTGLEDQPYSIILYGNDLYILLATVGKIVKIDVTATNPTPIDVVTGIPLSRGMAIKDNFLYIADFLGNKISKLELPTLTVEGCLEAKNGQYPSGAAFVPACDGLPEDITTAGWTGEYSLVTVTNGTEYIFTVSDPAYYITIGDETGTNVLSHGTGTVIWTANLNGDVRFYTHFNADCDWDAETFLTRTIQCGEIVEPTDYCEPMLDCTDCDVINNVTFAGIDNSTECSPDGYGEYTAQIGNVQAGETYSMSVTVGNGWDYESIMVWIDFNNDFIFDPVTEYFFIGSDSGTTNTADIAIPAETADGNYRLRVRVGAINPDLNDLSILACDDTSVFGETEDYTLNVGELGISEISSFDFIYYPNPVKDELNITSQKVIQSVSVYNLSGQQVSSQKLNVNNGKVSISSFAPGVYVFRAVLEGGQVETFKIIKK